MAPTRINNVWITFFFLLGTTINMLSTNASIAEDDEYWNNRKKASRKAIEEAYNPYPYNVTNHLNHQVRLSVEENLKHNMPGRNMQERYHGPCLATNPVDRCWRCDKDWAKNRQRLADCALGFGHGTTGGKGGAFYVVNDPSDDDLIEPKFGTLRHAVTREEPLWIIFEHPMIIKLQQELIVASNKTIDARGAQVHIVGGAGLMIFHASNVIIHGLYIRNIFPGKGGMIRDSANHFGFRGASDGDGISLFSASRVWIDHVSLARCSDGMIDAIMGSTAVSITNCHMTDHDEVLLFGAKDGVSSDKVMQITVAFNHFGKNLTQRMPRGRWGFYHVLNNDYTHWNMYAVGGNRQPTLLSQGNRYIAPNNDSAREVTKREYTKTGRWKTWTWRSEQDLFLNGAFFRQSGSPLTNNPHAAEMIQPQPGIHVRDLTRFVGPIKCIPDVPC